MNSRQHLQPFFNNSLSIRQEIQRFESVHPSIYAIYDLIEMLPDGIIAQQVRDHVVCIEDSFVNSQEWTMSRTVPDLRLGIVGSLSSGKSALVHRYLTGAYMQEESPEGGRFKKEVMVDGHSYLLLIRDEGGPPELQFASWVDAVIFVFSLENEASFNAVYTYYHKMAHLRNSTEIPFILVGTQDTVCENNPRVIDDAKARKLASELKRCSYYETCATYGLNVERVFQDACQKMVQQRLSSSTMCLTPSGSRPSTPLAAPAAPPTLRAPPHPNPSSLHGNAHSPSHNNHTGYNKDTLSRGHQILSASSNHLHRSDNSSNVDLHSLNGPDSGRWSHNTLTSHGSTQGLVTIATENNNIAKFAAPAGLDSLQLPNAVSKDLPTPSSTPTTSRKSRRRSNLFTPSKKGDDKLKNGELGSGRAIPVKQGYLYKKSSKALNKEWKKKYVALCDDGRLTYHPSINDYMENVHGKEISLQYVTVKVPGQKPRGSKSVITTVPGGQQAYSNGTTLNHTMGGLSLSNYNSKDAKAQRLTEKVLLTAYEVLKEPGRNSTNLVTATGGVQDDLSSSSSLAVPAANGDAGGKSETPHVKKRHRRMKSSGMKKDGEPDDQEVYEFCIVSLEGKRWRFEAPSSEERDAWVAAVERQILASLQGPGGAEAALSRHIHLVSGNNTCVDCGAADPYWASLNLGVLMCIECSGIHRNLGSHISRVRSLELDEWPAGHLGVMLSVGNTLANSVWESDLRGHTKPVPTSTREDKERWIRLKYEHKAFLSPGSDDVGGACLAALSGSLPPLIGALARARPADVNLRTSGRAPLHLACAAGDLPVAQLLIWNNANPNLLDADNMSCLQLSKLALAQISSSPVQHTVSHLQVSCPLHSPHHNSNITDTNGKQPTSKSPGLPQPATCICSLINMLSPIESVNYLIHLLVTLQNNSIINSLSNNMFGSQTSVPVNSNALNTSQSNMVFGNGSCNNDSHGSGTSLNSNNSNTNSGGNFVVPSSTATLSRTNNPTNMNGRCIQNSLGGSIV